MENLLFLKRLEFLGQVLIIQLSCSQARLVAFHFQFKECVPFFVVFIGRCQGNIVVAGSIHRFGRRLSFPCLCLSRCFYLCVLWLLCLRLHL